MSKQKQSLVPLISTIIVAVAAIVVAVVAIILLTSDNGGNNSSQNDPASTSSVVEEFVPTQELVDECTYAAHDLIAGNYKIVNLFITEGLPHFDEPYGNRPEDGIYTVDSKEYTSLKQIEDLVNSIFTEQEANRILTNIDGNGLAVYRNREVIVEVESAPESSEEGAETEASDTENKFTTEFVLGISESFVPDTDYNKDWSSVRIAVVPVTASECRLMVYLDGVDPTVVTSADGNSVLEVSMIKSDNGWRLTKFVY